MHYVIHKCATQGLPPPPPPLRLAARSSCPYLILCSLMIRILQGVFFDIFLTLVLKCFPSTSIYFHPTHWDAKFLQGLIDVSGVRCVYIYILIAWRQAVPLKLRALYSHESRQSSAYVYQICASLPSSSLLSQFLGGSEASKVFLERLSLLSESGRQWNPSDYVLARSHATLATALSTGLEL